MKTITYVSDNGYIANFANSPPYTLTKSPYSDLSATSHVGKSFGQDGVTTYMTSLNQRQTVIKGTIVAKGNYFLSAETILDEHKNFLSNCFNPKISGTLIYNNNRGGQIIRARPMATPTYGEVVNHQSVSLDIELESDFPYWESYELYEARMGTLNKMWRFPFSLSMKFGEYVSGVVVNNPGKIAIEPYFEVYSNSAFIKIINETTDKQITVTHDIEENQKMVIDSKTATVKLYENNQFVKDVSNWVTADSDFIVIEPGDNKFSVANANQDDVSTAHIYYRIPIAGV